MWRSILARDLVRVRKGFGRGLHEGPESKRIENGLQVLVRDSRGNVDALAEAWAVMFRWGCSRVRFMDEVLRTFGVRTGLELTRANPIAFGPVSKELDVYRRLLFAASQYKVSVRTVVEIAEAARTVGVDVRDQVKDIVRSKSESPHTLPQALELHRYFRERGWIQDDGRLYRSLALVYAQTDDTSGARKFLEQARVDGIEDLQSAYAQLIVTSQRLSRHTFAAELITDAKARGLYRPDLMQQLSSREGSGTALSPSRDEKAFIQCPSRSAYNSGRERRFGLVDVSTPKVRANLWLRRTATAKPPRIADYEATARKLGRMQDYRAVLQLYVLMQEDNVTTPTPALAFRILEACDKQRELTLANRLFEQLAPLPNSFFNVYMYEHLMNVGNQHREYSGVQHRFLDMLKRGIRPSVSTFTLLGVSYLKEEKFEEVKRVLAMMEAAGTAPNHFICTSFLHALALRGDGSMVSEVLACMDRNKVPMNTYTLSSLMTALNAGGMPAQAITAFQNATVNADTAVAVKPNIIVYTCVIKCLRALEAFEKLREVSEQVCGEMPINDRFLSQVMRGENEAGQYARTVEWFEKCTQLRVPRTEKIFTEALFAETERMNFEAAVDLVVEAAAKNIHLEDKHIRILFKNLAIHGQVGPAEKLLLFLCARGGTSRRNCEQLITMLASGHNTGRALGWIDRLAAAGIAPTAGMYNEILKGLEDVDAGILVVRRMKISGVLPDKETAQRLFHLLRMHQPLLESSSLVAELCGVSDYC